MSCITIEDPQLTRLAKAIAQRVGSQRFHVWFDNSTKLDLKADGGLDIAVPNDFISEWIGKNFTKPIQEAAHEVLGCSLLVRFNVLPQLFQGDGDGGASGNAAAGSARATLAPRMPAVKLPEVTRLGALAAPANNAVNRPRLRHEMETFIVGPSNHLAYNAAVYVAQYPGVNYNPLFIHGGCGLGKTHLLQGLCKQFQQHHPTLRWTYITGEDFTNEFVTALRSGKLEAFRRKMRDLDLLAIDDVHFLAGKKATQEEFLHTFNSIEASGKHLVMASDSHPKMIAEFGESLINRFVSGMVVRVDAPNYATRCEILQSLARRGGFNLPEEVTGWIAQRVTQNVRELEGAMTRISAHVRLCGGRVDIQMAQAALGDLDRHMSAPVKPESILQAVCGYFGVETKDLLSGRRQRTVSLARSVAMYLVRKTAKLSFPEIGQHMGKRNHSTVISAFRRIERAVSRNEPLLWSSAVGERTEEASELLQRLEEHCRAVH